MKSKKFAHAAGMRTKPVTEIAAAKLDLNAMADKDRLAANPAPTSPKRE
jgi:hypothetical protein